MRKLQLLILILSFFAIQSCRQNDSSSQDTETYNSDDETTEAYPDGTYAADVEYYNPDTGTRSTYTLNVEVESNEVTVIHWSNGGWLDSTHFSPEELDGDGSCSIATYDGKQYDIQITGSETSYTDESRVRSDDYYEKKQITCPNCGGKKYRYDDICDDCKRKKKDIEEHTCKICGEYDSFMFSSDDMCSDCKRKKEDAERQENDDDN